MTTQTNSSGRDFAREAEDAARRFRQIQREAEVAENPQHREGPPKTGARDYPVPPFPAQHQDKPGSEDAVHPAPMFDAPYWRGSGKLDGFATIVTGGDSGIGRAVAVLFAREGADVAIVYLDEHEDAQETKRVVESEGRRAILLSGDVSDHVFCRYAVDETLRAFGRLDVLVNNAAFQQHSEWIGNVTEEQFDRTMKTNLYGYFHMAKAAAAHLREGGSIINTGSVTGLAGSKHLLEYSMTKGGIHAFTRSLAGHLLPRAIRVNAVAPGPVWTPLNPADKAAEQNAKFGADVPMKRPAQPEELSPAFVFLASPQCSSYITGEILPVIGGY